MQLLITKSSHCGGVNPGWLDTELWSAVKLILWTEIFRVLNRVFHSLGSLGSWPPLHFFLPQNKLSKQIPHCYWEINTKRLPYLFWLRIAPCFPSTSRVSYFRSPSLAWTSTVSKWSTCLPPLLYPACPLHCCCWASWSQMQLSHPFLCVLVKKILSLWILSSIIEVVLAHYKNIDNTYLDRKSKRPSDPAPSTT